MIFRLCTTTWVAGVTLFYAASNPMAAGELLPSLGETAESAKEDQMDSEESIDLLSEIPQSVVDKLLEGKEGFQKGTMEVDTYQVADADGCYPIYGGTGTRCPHLCGPGRDYTFGYLTAISGYVCDVKGHNYQNCRDTNYGPQCQKTSIADICNTQCSDGIRAAGGLRNCVLGSTSNIWLCLFDTPAPFTFTSGKTIGNNDVGGRLFVGCNTLPYGRDEDFSDCACLVGLFYGDSHDVCDSCTIRNYQASGIFGIDGTINFDFDCSSKIKDDCASMVNGSCKSNLISPTPRPTRPPTTPRPTRRPTPIPTRRPTTPRPTKSPESAPTKFPSNSPTKSPTPSPTNPPTTDPSSPPSPNPSSSPTDQPTINPSPAPSSIPTSAPSRSPFSEPTLFPTSETLEEIPSPTGSGTRDSQPTDFTYVVGDGTGEDPRQISSGAVRFLHSLGLAGSWVDLDVTPLKCHLLVFLYLHDPFYLLHFSIFAHSLKKFGSLPIIICEGFRKHHTNNYFSYRSSVTTSIGLLTRCS